jgi:hypothetical protein
MSYSKAKLLLLSIFVTTGYSLDSFAETPTSGPATFEGRKVYMDSEINDAIQSNLLMDIDKLISQNSADFQGLDLFKLKSRIPDIKIFIAAGEPLTGSGVRNGAINFTRENFVILNNATTKSQSHTQTKLLHWHEALGALGYNDENYLISGSIYMKVTTPHTQFTPTLKQRLEKQFNEPLNKNNKIFRSIDGGATGVGGGGDGQTAEIKTVLLYYLNEVAPSAQNKSDKVNALIDLAIDTPIESKEYASEYLSLKEYGRLSIGINRYNTKISLLVDPKEWHPIRPQTSLSESNFELLMQITTVLRNL